jgi:hypothetical protein
MMDANGGRESHQSTDTSNTRRECTQPARVTPCDLEMMDGNNGRESNVTHVTRDSTQDCRQSETIIHGDKHSVPADLMNQTTAVQEGCNTTSHTNRNVRHNPEGMDSMPDSVTDETRRINKDVAHNIHEEPEKSEETNKMDEDGERLVPVQENNMTELDALVDFNHTENGTSVDGNEPDPAFCRDARGRFNVRLGTKRKRKTNK